LLLAFVRREARLTRTDAGPLLDLRLFRVPTFVTGVVFAVVFFCSNTGIPLVLSLYYQDGLGFTALDSGLGVTALALGSVLVAPLGAGLASGVSGRPGPYTGAVTSALAVSLLFSGSALALSVVELRRTRRARTATETDGG